MAYHFTVVDSDRNELGVITNLDDLRSCGFDIAKYSTYSEYETSIVTDVLPFRMGNINEIEKPIKVGSIFSSAKHIQACLEIGEDKEKRRGYLYTSKKQTDRVVFVCKVEECNFCVRAAVENCAKGTRARTSYSNAARSVKEHPIPLRTLKDALNVPNVGKKIAQLFNNVL